MALEDTPSIISYAGNGSTVTAYPLPFVFFSDDDIALYVDGVLSADTFSIIGDKFAGTATVVTDVAYTAEQDVTFQREVSYDQPTVLPGSGRTDPTTLERAYDYLSMQIQQVAREVEESPKAAPGDTTPGGSFSEAANTTVGQDANGDLVMRSAAEEVAFLGIGTSVDAAVASAAAALVSETNAATSETNAAASEANAAASEAAALNALNAIPASLSASNTFTIATNDAVGSILLTFDGGGVFWAGPGNQDEAAQGLADLINAGVHPVTATATGNILRVVAKLPGDDGNGISCVVVMGGAFGSWAGPETTGGSISNLVLTSTQSLTSTQKAQARENIGAASSFGTIGNFSSDVVSLVLSHDVSLNDVGRIGWLRALQELEDGGILDEMVDGACLRPGYNVAGSWKSIRNASATVRGTVAQTIDGARFVGNVANTLSFPVSAVRAFTMGVDFAYDENAPAASSVCSINNVGGSNVSAMALATPLGAGVVYNADGGSAVNTTTIGPTAGSAFTVNRYVWIDTFASFSSDNAATPAIWAHINGMRRLTDATGQLQLTSDMTEVTLGAYRSNAVGWQLPMSGTIAAWFVFGRQLTDAENVTLAKALRHLDPRRKNLVTCGDSRTTQQPAAGFGNENWPLQYWQSPSIRGNYRLCNVAENGWSALVWKGEKELRIGHLGPNGTSILEADFFAMFGPNDYSAGQSGATVYGHMLDIFKYASSLGMRTTALTDLPAYDSLSAGNLINTTQRTDLNVLLRANRAEFDSLLDVAEAFDGPRDRRWWYDGTHPNKAGYGQIAKLLINGSSARDPKISSITLDQDVVKANNTIDSITLVTPTSEGIATMGFYLEPLEKVWIDGFFYVDQAANPLNYRVGITKPSGCFSAINNTTTAKGGTGNQSSGDPDTPFSNLATGTGGGITKMSGWIKNGATAGTINITFAQLSTDAGKPATLREGSLIRINR